MGKYKQRCKACKPCCITGPTGPHGVEPNQFTLFQNGAPVSGSVYGSGAGTQGNNGMVIIILII